MSLDPTDQLEFVKGLVQRDFISGAAPKQVTNMSEVHILRPGRIK
jgi:hypothetical protein